MRPSRESIPHDIRAQLAHTLHVDAAGIDDLTLVSFAGEESLSSPFAFDVVASTTQDLASLSKELLGADARLTLSAQREARRG
ncbi:MAG: hypothetical protein R3A52_02535 [Polyangiales bacterium]